MIQACQFPVSRIEGGKIGALVKVTVMTGKREIVRDILSAMLARSDVFNVERQQLLALMHLTILAAIFRASPNQLTQAIVHQAALALASTLRALAWRIPITVLACT